MSKKDEILRQAEEQKRLEAERKRLGKQDEPVHVKPSRMPIGCLMWICFAIFVIWYLVTKALKN